MDFPLETLLQVELFRLGARSITVGAAAAAALIVLLAAILSRATVYGLRRLQRRAGAEDAPSFYVAERLGGYAIFFVGLLAAVSTLGIDLTSLSLFAGALGVGIGLGLQEIVKNFMSGLVLLLDKSVSVGDFIELDPQVAGEVTAIGSRAVTIVTNDNVNVLVPNSFLVENKLTNWTRNRNTRRVHVPFIAPYGVDKDKVRLAALEAARSVAFTLPDEGHRRAQVWLVGFGEGWLKFELVVWPTLEAVKRPGAMMAAYTWAIDEALRRHKLEIPHPQLDLHVRTVFGRTDGTGLGAIRPDPSPNDAADLVDGGA